MQKRLLMIVRQLEESDSDAAAVVLQSFSTVLPQLPGLIRSRLPEADAVIYTREALLLMLAEFAKDLLNVQTRSILQLSRKRDA